MRAALLAVGDVSICQSVAYYKHGCLITPTTVFHCLQGLFCLQGFRSGDWLLGEELGEKMGRDQHLKHSSILIRRRLLDSPQLPSSHLIPLRLDGHDKGLVESEDFYRALTPNYRHLQFYEMWQC